MTTQDGTVPPAPGYYRASDGRDYPIPDGYYLASDGQLYPVAPARPPMAPAAPAAAAAGRGWDWGPASILTLVGAATVVIGAFLPWAKVGPVSVNGTEGDGSITLVLALAAAALGAAGILKASKGMIIGALVLMGLIVVIGMIDVADITSTDAGPFGLEASVGGGLIVTVLGGVAGIIGTVLALRDRNAIS